MKPLQQGFFSTVTGTELNGIALDAAYWWQNIREPVAFHQVMSQWVAEFGVVVEIGAHPVLSGYIKEAFKECEIKDSIVIPTLSREASSPSSIELSIASIWASGAELEWRRYFPVTGQLVNVPAYPWQREEYWDTCLK
ncbi:MAG: acyltransferase domain-containing protein [Nitrincola sp.]|nr:acyltransferase domain-containing protein [Nitrincola sp.]